MIVPRRFAIATKEVSVEQWQKFERTNTEPGTFVHNYSPDPDGPMISINWYIAAKYCNWLSEQEGLPKDQWCYLPNEAGADAEGMTIPADVLDRTGYRLPTDAEWEFACRAGTVTSYYFGLSNELLGRYAWYQVNGKDHAWSCGALLPNDLGMFDMIGNEFEWVLDGLLNRSAPEQRGLVSDNRTIYEHITNQNSRFLRGGSFRARAADVRSAFRDKYSPSMDLSSTGFRLARTYH